MYTIIVELKKESPNKLLSTLREAGFSIFAKDEICYGFELLSENFLPKKHFTCFSCYYGDCYGNEGEIPERLDKMLKREMKKDDSVIIRFVQEYRNPR